MPKYDSVREMRYLRNDKTYSGNTRLKKSRKVGQKQTPQEFCGDLFIPGGWGGIRTPGGVAPTAVFKTVAFDRSATHPKLSSIYTACLSNLRFCSLLAPDGAAHHSFALDFTSFVLLTRMQDRRIRPLCHPS